MDSALPSFGTRLLRRLPRWQVVRAGGIVERRQAGRVRRPEGVFPFNGRTNTKNEDVTPCPSFCQYLVPDYMYLCHPQHPSSSRLG